MFRTAENGKNLSNLNLIGKYGGSLIFKGNLDKADSFKTVPVKSIYF